MLCRSAWHSSILLFNNDVHGLHGIKYSILYWLNTRYFKLAWSTCPFVRTVEICLRIHFAKAASDQFCKRQYRGGSAFHATVCFPLIQSFLKSFQHRSRGICSFPMISRLPSWSLWHWLSQLNHLLPGCVRSLKILSPTISIKFSHYIHCLQLYHTGQEFMNDWCPSLSVSVSARINVIGFSIVLHSPLCTDTLGKVKVSLVLAVLFLKYFISNYFSFLSLYSQRTLDYRKCSNIFVLKKSNKS